MNFDVLVVGAGLAGLVAAAEAADAGRSVAILDQEGEASLGGQAFWSFGGLFLVNSPEQRRLGIRDSRDLAWSDWLSTANFDREGDEWPKRWAEAYLDFACGEKRAWLHEMGIRFFPSVGWAERGGGSASGPGNSVPRFHVTWGTGPGVLAPFLNRVREHEKNGRIQIFYRHRAERLERAAGHVVGVSGEILEPTRVARGEASSRIKIGEFSIRAQAVIATSGGIGGNAELVRRAWPTDRLGPAPKSMLCGVPAHVDGLFQQVLKDSGANLIHPDRMWHYTEGLRNWNPIWKDHGIRVLPGPSSLWLDPLGRRLPFPLYPGSDTLGTLKHITQNGFNYTWFILNRAIIKKEFALSGSEQNPDLTGKSIWQTLQRMGKDVQKPVQNFLDRGTDFVIQKALPELIASMKDLVGDDLLDGERVTEEVLNRDSQLQNRAGKDAQLAIAREARKYLSEKLIRVSEPRPLLDLQDGPLIAVRMNLLTRKTLGGIQTDLKARVLDRNEEPIKGLFAAGEVTGFGGGGMHGYRSLEGTFLGGCLFSGRVAGRSAAATVR